MQLRFFRFKNHLQTKSVTTKMRKSVLRKILVLLERQEIIRYRKQAENPCSQLIYLPISECKLVVGSLKIKGRC